MHPSILAEYQQDPMRGTISHIDLREVRLDQPIHATVVVQLVGESEGAKTGGVLSLVTREVHVEALPAEVPEHIDVDVSHMEVGDVLRLEDVPAIESVTFLDDPARDRHRDGRPCRAASGARGGGRRGRGCGRGLEEGEEAEPRRRGRVGRGQPTRAPTPRSSPCGCSVGARPPRRSICSSQVSATPDREHARDRHNVGWMVVDELARRRDALVQVEVQRAAWRDADRRAAGRAARSRRRT